MWKNKEILIYRRKQFYREPFPRFENDTLWKNSCSEKYGTGCSAASLIYKIATFLVVLQIVFALSFFAYFESAIVKD